MNKALEQIAAAMEVQTALLTRLEKDRTKTPATSGTAIELHGDGSVFGSHSVERDVVTAHVRPMGLGAVLPKIPTVAVVPFFATITGFTGDIGSEPATPCEDGPVSHMKGCNLTAQFGRVARDTRTIEINDAVLKKNRGDFTDLMLMGSLLGLSGFSPGSMTDSDVLNIQTKAEMVSAVISLERKLSDHLWNGSPANNNEGGGYKEFPGLSNQIATGQVDANDNVACPALDSDIKDFLYAGVCGAPATDTGFTKDIVEYLSMLEAFLRYNALTMGFEPFVAAIVLRPELWTVLSDCWPCQSHSTGCGVVETTAIDVVPSLDAAGMMTLRNQMRTGKFIDINGTRYPVVVDGSINEETNITNANLGLGQYASSIFFVPLKVRGGFPVTYIEYVNYQAAVPDTNLLRGTETFWSDDGRYFWAAEYIKFCFKLTVKSEQRVVLRTPHLAGRIDNVMYEPLQHYRSADPENPYWADGGISVRGDSETFAVWK
jgi:hypothetical protein